MFRTKIKLVSHEKVCKDHGFCDIVMADKINQTLKCIPKFYEGTVFIYADLESLIKKILGCKSNPEKTFTIKVMEQTTHGYSISAICGFWDKK